MSDDLRTSAIQWATQLELVIKKVPSIRDYEINIDLLRSTSFIGEIDGRGRWGNQLRSSKSVGYFFQVRAFFNNGLQSFVQDTRHFADSNQTPEGILKRLLDSVNKIPTQDEEGIFKQRMHLNQNFEIFDPRFSKVDSEMRRELLLEHVNMMRHMNNKARVHKLELIEQERFRHYRTTINNFIEHSSSTAVKGNIHIGIERESFHIKARRFADLCIHPLGWSTYSPPPKPSESIRSVQKDWMLMLAPNIVASIIGCLPPAFEIERLENGNSFLSNKMGEVIGSKRVHLIDDATMLSGLHTRNFDARGVPPKPLTLISDGVLQDCYVPLDWAQQNGKNPTGHTHFNNELWCGNLLSQMGRRSQNMILADKGDAILATHLLEPTTVNIKTGLLRLVANFDYITSQGVQARLGTRTIEVPVIEVFSQVMETANDQNRFNHIDSSTWVLENCSLLS